ncbi:MULTISPECIES: Ig-like domain-containing protein, partial [Enterobacterales]|uniref:Ig-like domain-containing protein n=1 Tax=Enterobacterales TaxID=91347 RepID=UPI002EDA4A56
MRPYIWSNVNPGNLTQSYSGHTESYVSASLPVLETAYPSSQYPLQYLGLDNTLAVPVIVELEGPFVGLDTYAATAFVPGSATQQTTLAAPNIPGALGFIGTTAGSSTHVELIFGKFNDTNGQVEWSTNGSLDMTRDGTQLVFGNMTGLPEGWTFHTPVKQADGSWRVTLSGGAVSHAGVLYNQQDYTGSHLKFSAHESIQVNSGAGWLWRSVRLSELPVLLYSSFNVVDTFYHYNSYQLLRLTQDTPDFSEVFTGSSPVQLLSLDESDIQINVQVNTTDSNDAVLVMSQTYPLAYTSAAIRTQTGVLAILPSSGAMQTINVQYGSLNGDGTATFNGQGSLTVSLVNGVPVITPDADIPFDWLFGTPIQQTDGCWLVTLNDGAASSGLSMYPQANYQGTEEKLAEHQAHTLRTLNYLWQYDSARMNGLRLLGHTVFDPNNTLFDYRSYRDSYYSQDVPDISADYPLSSPQIQGIALGDNDVVVRVRLTPNDPGSRVVLSAAQNWPLSETYAMASLTLEGVAQEGVLVVFDKTNSAAPIAVNVGVLNQDGTADWRVNTEVTAVWNEALQQPLLILDESTVPEDWQFVDMQPGSEAGEFDVLLTGTFPSAWHIESLNYDKSTIYDTGTDAATLTATVVDANGVAAEGVIVSWSTSVGTLSEAESVTNAAGQATTQLTSTDDGTALVTATLDNGSTAQANITVSYIYIDSLSSDKSSIVNDDADSATLTATVVDSSTNLPVSGVTVTWNTTLGNLNITSSVTNGSGQASTQLTAEQEGTATVTAQLDNGNRATLTITVEDKSVNYVVSSLTSDKDSIVNDGTDAAALTATVVDSRTNLPVSGVTVTWNTTLGNLNITSSVTNGSGQASTQLTAEQEGTATVTAQLDNGSRATLTITVEDKSVNYVVSSLTSDKDSIFNDGTDAAALTATVVDSRTNLPVSGVTVTWNTTLGNLNITSSVTNGSGQASTQLTAEQEGTATVTAQLDNGNRATLTITVEDKSVNYVVSSLTSDKDSIVNDGTDAAALTATVVDSRTNLPVSGVTVTWNTTLGNLNITSSVTNGSGQASTQ